MADLDQDLLLAVESTSVRSTAAELRYTDRNRGVKVDHEVATYIGYLDSIIFHASGRIGLTIRRGAARAEVRLEPDAAVTLYEMWDSQS